MCQQAGQSDTLESRLRKQHVVRASRSKCQRLYTLQAAGGPLVEMEPRVAVEQEA